MLKRMKDDVVLISSMALVYDDSLPAKTPQGNVVAFVLYTAGGAIIYKHNEDYTDEEILVAGESFFGETFRSARWKTYKAELIKE